MFRIHKFVLLVGLLCLLPVSGACAQTMDWNLVNPAGVVEKLFVEPAPRLTTLEGKTIVLRWNFKHNGNVVLDRIAELLARDVPSAKVIKSYVEDPSLNNISATETESARITQGVLAFKPDLVIGSQAD